MQHTVVDLQEASEETGDDSSSANYFICQGSGWALCVGVRVDPGTAAVLLLRQSISFQVESSR